MVSVENLADGDVTCWDYCIGMTDENGRITVDTAEWEMEAGEYLVCVAGQYSSRDTVVSAPGGILLQVVEEGSLPDTLPGDLDGNGRVESEDARLLLQALAEGRESDLSDADFNGDGRTDSSDAVLLLRAVG